MTSEHQNQEIRGFDETLQQRKNVPKGTQRLEN